MADVGRFAGLCFTNLSEDLGVGRISENSFHAISGWTQKD